MLPGAFGLLAVLVVQEAAALTIQVDYSYDSGGFFNDPKRRECLRKAAAVFEGRIQNPIPAIIPSGGNTWSLGFPDPSTGEHVSLSNPVLAANTIRIYVGAHDTPGLLGYAEYGYSWSGFGGWITLFNNRDNANQFQSFGGSITFNDRADYYFDDDPATLEPFGGYDFFSVAQHEIAHLLGFGTSGAFGSRTSNGAFVGAGAVAFYGGPVPLANSGHLEQGLFYRYQYVNMAPAFSGGMRNSFSELDFAVLGDIGWKIARVPDVRLARIVPSQGSVLLQWTGGVGPFRVQATDQLDSPAWVDITADLPNRSLQIAAPHSQQWFRVIDLPR